MKIEEFKDLIKDGEIFTVEFTKKNGERRVMNAQFGVTEHLTGKGAKYNAADYGLVTVFDVDKQAYRNVTVANIISVTKSGTSTQEGRTLTDAEYTASLFEQLRELFK